MRIRDIVPVRSPKVIAGMKAQRQKWARADVEIEVVPIERGPFSMEFATEEVLAGPYVLQAVGAGEHFLGGELHRKRSSLDRHHFDLDIGARPFLPLRL